MCNRILIWLLLLVSGIFCLMSAQTNRFYYNLEYRKDSTETYRSNIMILDVDSKYVKFYDKDFADYDSINKNSHESYSRYQTKSDQLIKRKINSNINEHYRDFFDYFVIKTNDEMSWTISPEMKKYEGYQLQKATTNFGGRQWTAWFAKDIDISEGPYKFRGLPGLIFMIEDSDKNFLYQLIKNKKVTTISTNDFLETHYGKKAIQTTSENFTKYAVELYENPTRLFSDAVKSGQKMTVNNESVESAEALNKQKQQMQFVIKNMYIYIEKDKAPIFK